MRVSQRERWFMLIGGAIAGLTVLITWVIAPLAGAWSYTGHRMARQLEALDALQNRADRRESLIAQRTRLSGKIGCLLDPAEYARGASEGEEGENGKARKDGPNPPKPEPKLLTAEPPPAGWLEKTIKKQGGQVKLISVVKAPRNVKRWRSFRMVALQADVECNAESLVKLLHAFEKGERFVRVDDLKIRHEMKKPDALSVTLRILAYEKHGEA